LAERWRQPVTPLSIEPVDQGLWLPDGRRLAGVQLTLSPVDIERMRAGYVCAKCLEPFEQAWPERCHVCGAPIRTAQAEYFANEYAGEVDLGPRTSLADERAGLEERRRKEEESNGSDTTRN
jgi:hypothetical protein